MGLEEFLGINSKSKEGNQVVKVVEKPIMRSEERQNGKSCLFLRKTWYGTRCVLMSPEDWKRFRNNGNRLPCWNGGNNCNLKIRILSLRWEKWEAE